MTEPHVFRCNLALPRRRSARNPPATELSTLGRDPNVTLRLADIAKVLVQDLDGRLADLVELASFVYAADGAVKRSGWSRDGSEERWRRRFRLEMGVRDPAFWNGDEVGRLLRRLLGLLSDDTWEFRFQLLAGQPGTQTYLQLGPDAPEDWPFRRPERVVMFSGGLDSLAGAAEMAERGGPLLLVSHRGASIIESRQAELLNRLRSAYPGVHMRRVAVWVNKDGAVGKEFTQRTRSFLFWALGTAVAQSVEAGGVRFFENGVVSLNLPIADQVQGARASRTTHPLALQLMEELAGVVVGRHLIVDNPYIFDTKTDVVRRVLATKEPDLIRSTCSCTRTRTQRAQGWHCGLCSQCIDRRLACLAAGAGDHDPAMDYNVDALEGARPKELDQQMAAFYARHAKVLSEMTADDVADRFALELPRAARAFSDPGAAGTRLAEMHVRHGRDVAGTMDAWVRRNARPIVGGTVEPTSLMGMVLGREHVRPSWERLARRLCGILDAGLPRLCQTDPPKNEPRLQEMCDGLFAVAGEDLDREFPFAKWGGRMTKPDWSSEEVRLWVELKYVRQKADVLQVNEAIAADITKYGDAGQRCLFVTYDPTGHIVDAAAFAGAIERHDGCMAHIVR